jgi:pyridoxine kinase
MKRVLSIQSHVVSGYVGNKSATFPLQLLGCEVDPLNTVQFSNHSGYPVFLGEKLSQEAFTQVLKGLEENGLDQDYSHILCGKLENFSISTIRNLITKKK